MAENYIGNEQVTGSRGSNHGVVNLESGKWEIDDVAVTASAAELNILDGVTATGTELNILSDGLKVYRFTYSFAVLGGAQGAISLTATSGNIPDNFYIQSVALATKAAATSGGAATIKIGITGNDNAFIDATAYTDNAFDTLNQGTALTAELPLITTAATGVLWTVGGADLTAGIHEVLVCGFDVL